jgi:hypothetical protein
VFLKALTDRLTKLKNSFAGDDPSLMVLFGFDALEDCRIQARSQKKPLRGSCPQVGGNETPNDEQVGNSFGHSVIGTFFRHSVLDIRHFSFAGRLGSHPAGQLSKI